ncbi:cobalamin biosynthesis protein [Aeromicrobium sp. Root495]|uniref:cobalamin biosynthesis protein n=1 Tax=Aeromicrobium sp. Root495 TaxID=1736550 RepID=UPI000A4CBF96|nr:cobalamin biosynthesis protein [Aeromicrobium sp. Root495]
MGLERALGLGLGFAADRAFGDPQRWHPVAGFGRAAGALERRLWADSRPRGAVFTAVAVGVPVVVARVVERRNGRAGRLVLTAVSTWAVLGARSLEREALAVGALLDADDLPAARQRLTHLVGRRTSELTEPDVVRAVVESVAENTSDAVVAPLFWGGAAGVPGLIGYRAANTLDAMVGHRTERLLQFGWASARLDDVLNLLPARLAALLAAGLGSDPSGALAAWRRDAGDHPSPNAGPVEASFAGALGIQLGGETIYASGVEQRPRMGSGPAPALPELRRATALARRVDLGALAVAALLALRPRRR